MDATAIERLDPREKRLLVAWLKLMYGLPYANHEQLSRMCAEYDAAHEAVYGELPPHVSSPVSSALIRVGAANPIPSTLARFHTIE